ncbi:hypothetical protein HDU84_008176, partial [Entophlyctis sp. JEL0112]
HESHCSTNGGDQAGSNAEPAEHGARDLTHFLLYGNGFRTWEYAPEFNIRSWSYAGLYAVLGLVAIPFVGFDNKVAHTVSLHYRKAIYHKSRQIGVFYAIRAILAIMCAFVEYQLVVATRKWYGRQIANWLLLYLIFAPGMTAASTAYLTSSFSMYFTTLAFSCWLNPTASIKRIATVVGLTIWSFKVDHLGEALGSKGVGFLGITAVVDRIFYGFWSVVPMEFLTLVGVVGTVGYFIAAGKIASQPSIAVSAIEMAGDGIIPSSTEQNSGHHIRPQKRKAKQSLVNRIGSLKNLKRLMQSTNMETRESALQILLTRAMSDDYFGEIMLFCWDQKDVELREKAICVVQQLTRIGLHFLDYSLVNEDESFSNDLRYWSLLVVHQLSLLESLHAILILKQMIPILGLMTRSTFGNSNMQKYCLHSLVRLISSLGTDAQKKLSELIDLNIVSIIGGCLKNDDGELVSWAVFFIQEFVTRDIARVEFAKIRGIAKILVDTIDHPISGAESFMPRVTLRTLKCLAVRNNEFQQEILKFGVLKKIIPFLESGDTEAQFWAISLLHDIIENIPESHEKFFSMKGLDALIRMTNTAAADVCLYASNIFVFLCGIGGILEVVTVADDLIGKNRQTILQSDILSSIVVFCQSHESDIQYGGALLMLNIATFSDESALNIADREGIEILSDLVLNSGRQDLQVVAAKALSTMARKESEIHDVVFQLVIDPLVEAINSLTFIAKNSSELHTLMECFQIFLQPDFLKPPGESGSLKCSEAFIFNNLNWTLVTEPLCMRVIDMLLLPFITNSFGIEDAFSGVPPSEVILLKRDIHTFFADRIEAVANTLSELSADETPMDASTRYFFSFKALNLLIYLFQNDNARFFFEANSISVIFVSLIRLTSKLLANQAISTLAMCLAQGLSRSSLLNVTGSTKTILNYLLTENSASANFYGSLIFDNLADSTYSFSPAQFSDTNSTQSVEISLSTVTPYLFWSRNKMEIRNDSWTFESARTNASVSKKGKFAYEIVLRTDGIIQVGWATASCTFDPEGGEGVGDNEHSYAFDGNRMKKWHSYFTSNNEYGEQWSANDVITVLIDFDEQTVSFLLNGKNLGIAFTEVNPELDWYPAVSLAGGQGCVFYFGGATDPLKFVPDGFKTIYESKFGTSFNKPRIFSSTEIANSAISVNTAISSAAEGHQWRKPSFYFEVAVPAFETDQFSSILSVTTLTLFLQPGSNRACCLFVPSGAYDYQFNQLEEMQHAVRIALDDNDFETEDFKIVAMVNAFCVAEGDVFGCGYSESDNTICFTINGEPINVMIKGDGSTCLPHLRGISKFTVNYGMWTQKTVRLAAKPRGCHLVTSEILAAVGSDIAAVNVGVCHIFIQHTSASLSLNENADPDVRVDMETVLNRLVPEKAAYVHADEGPDDMPAHVKASLMGASVSIPISRGRLALGTWQGVWLCEHRNAGGRRNLVVTINGE